MLSILYSVVFTFAFILFLPYGIYQALRHGKYKKSFFKRFGVGFPVIRTEKGPLIWVHAVSVGECQAVSRLVNRIQAEVAHATIIISSITETGHEEAKRLFPKAQAHLYLPFDFSWCVARVFKRCRPDLIILAEGDFWFQFLQRAKKENCPVVVVNGKISEKSTKRFQFFSAFTRALFSPIQFFCVQSELYRERFISLGISSSKILSTGNLKGDAPLVPISETETEELKEKLALKPSDFVIVIGSTHNPEEDLLLKELIPLLKQFDHLKLIIAPRHPERFGDVIALVEKQNVTHGSWTKGFTSPNPQIIVVDAMGILRKLYQIADLAIVAGSFTEKVGGHNILEAQAYGVPVIVGPYMHTQQALLDTSLEYDAIVQVSDDKVQAAVRELITNTEERKQLAVNSLKLANALTGATERTFDALKTYLVQKASEEVQ